MATQEAIRTRERPQEVASRNEDREIAPFEDIVEYMKAYSRQKPENAALICIGLGFVLGWKLKPW